MSKYFILLISLMTFLSCHKNDEYIDIIIDKPNPPGKIIETNLMGLVTDPKGIPIVNAQVNIGKMMTRTDNNGFYQFKNVYINDLQDYIFIVADNYFDGLETVDGFAGDLSFRRTILEEKIFTNSFLSSQDAFFRYDNLYDIEIPANALLTQSGTLFTGKYKIAPKYRDPGLFKEQQAAYFVKDSNSTIKLLTTKYHLGIEAWSIESGELLSFTKRIKIKYTAPSSSLNATLRLFYFDIENKVWKESVQMNYTNGFYQFETTQVNNLCIGRIDDYALCTGVVGQDNGRKMQFSQVQNLINNEPSYKSRTTYSGRYKIYFAKSASNNFSLHSECNVVSYQFELPSMSSDFEKNIVLHDKIPFLNEISGSVIQCDGSNDIRGYMIITNKMKKPLAFPILAFGKFETQILCCNTEGNEIKAVDTGNNISQSYEINITFRENFLVRLCEDKVSSLARFSFNMIDTSYSNCRVRKIASQNTANIIYIFEYGNKGQFTEKLILEKLSNQQNGFYWRMTHSSFIQNTYKLKELINEPDFYLFNENGVNLMECNLPKVIIENDQTKEKFISDVVFFRAVIQ
ncbi:MAG: carboxypeptidase regulatory-like domain-containing protein [Saprospiraceae bacterium]|nr:carboxypeptidase regulatory-like domain-containing protein [Saprospiraceae bacterium]